MDLNGKKKFEREESEGGPGVLYITKRLEANSVPL